MFCTCWVGVAFVFACVEVYAFEFNVCSAYVHAGSTTHAPASFYFAHVVSLLHGRT